MSKNHKWTKEEDYYIRETYNGNNDEEISIYLKRTVSSIKVRRQKLGITKSQFVPEKNVVGSVHNALVILSVRFIQDKNGHRIKMARCRCDFNYRGCVREKDIYLGNVTGNKVISCGCYQNYRNDIQKSNRRFDERIHNIWTGMLSRCRNSNNPKFHIYGNRGISVCQEWLDFENFHEWAINHGYDKTLSIHRVDNDGNYCPENCIWADDETQANERGNNRLLTIFGETKTLARWVKDSRCVCPEQRLRDRIINGWDAEEALTTGKVKGPRFVTAWGETKFLQEWVRDHRCKVKLSGLIKRLKNGWSPEDAIGKPPKRETNLNNRPQ